MVKDRDQKQLVLSYILSQRWFPHLELDVGVPVQTGNKVQALTDIDVLASIPDPFCGLRNIVFDCKTGKNESPINRAIWVKGLSEYIGASHGFCILKRQIPTDHRLSAAKFGISLLTEKDFEKYAASTVFNQAHTDAQSALVTNWEKFHSEGKRFPNLSNAILFTKKGYWESDNASVALRKTIAILREISNELNPKHDTHVALVADLVSLFLRSLSQIATELFHIYLLPETGDTLSEATKLFLYGGKEAYEHRNQLWHLIPRRQSVEVPDLTLPEWDLFLKLLRQLLDAPSEILMSAILSREVGFSKISGAVSKFSVAFSQEHRQAARFVILATSYLQKATKYPDAIQNSLLQHVGGLQIPPKKTAPPSQEGAGY